jgi:hypothetical protein
MAPGSRACSGSGYTSGELRERERVQAAATTVRAQARGACEGAGTCAGRVAVEAQRCEAFAYIVRSEVWSTCGFGPQ